MHVVRSMLLSISSVSALILDTGLRLTSPSTTKLDYVSNVSKSAQGPWHTSEVSNMSPVSLNMTNLSTTIVNRDILWRCSNLLGFGPYAASCEDAANHMAFIPRGADESQQLGWSIRRTPTIADVPLPQEVLSSDGHCRINVHLRGRNVWNFARASQAQVKAGVDVIVHNCMRIRERSVGGSAWKINDDGLLEVWAIISDQVPPVTCYGRMSPDAERSCKWLLDQVPADSDFKTTFGPRTDPHAETHLPWLIGSRLADGRCALTVRTAGPSDLAYWGTLWESAVELSSICARQGMQGRKVQLGDGRYLAVFLTDPSAEEIQSS